jgi:hypothetical protein
MKEVQFSETNWLRLTSILCMGIADIALVADLWWIFFNLFLVVLLSELLRKRLFEVMLYKYEVENRNRNRNRKLQQIKEHAEELVKMRSRGTN